MNTLPMNSTNDEVQNEIRQKLLSNELIHPDWILQLLESKEAAEEIEDLKQEIKNLEEEISDFEQRRGY